MALSKGRGRRNGFALLAAAAILCPNISVGQEGYRISHVEFRGNSAIDSDRLSEQLLLPPYTWLEVAILGKDESTFSPETIRRETESLRRFYQTEGFLRAQVTGSLDRKNDGSRTVELSYTIVEGIPVVVGTTTITVSDSLTPLASDVLLAELDSAVVLKSGKQFRDAQLLQDADAIITVLNNSGFPYAEPEHAVRMNETLDTVDVVWTIDRGPLSRFGSYSVEGFDRYHLALITDRVAFREGEIYQRRVMEQTQRDLYDLGLYRTVSVKAALRPERPPEVPVLISVRESSRYRVQLGVGYGRDEEFRVTGRLDVLGIFGTAGQVGLEVRRSALEPVTVLVSYTHPDFLIPKTRFTVRPFIRHENEPGYEARRRGYDVGFARPLFRDSYTVLQYSVESVDMSSAPDVTLPSNFRTDYPKEAVILTLGYNSARPLFDPFDGVSAALVVTYSGLEWLRSDQYHFSRTLADIRWYGDLSEWMVIAARVKFGSQESHDLPEFIPFEERFYAGGSVSIRGWGRSLLGPLDPSGNPIGGNSLFETGVEFRFPRSQSISGVLFVDAGNVWEESLTYKMNELGYSAGAGVRYATPIGPLRLDVAHPIGRGSDRVQWWFSIGHAF